MDQKAQILSTIESMTSAFNRGDIDGIMQTYEAGAVVVGAPGVPASGADSLRAMFAGFIAAKARFTFFGHEVFQASDIAPLLAAGLFVLATPLIYVVLERQFGRTAALWGVALIAFSPPAYVLSMAYSEPLFLLLVAALFATRSGPVRVVLGLALGVTRLTGVAVAAAQGLRWLRDWRDWRAVLTATAIGVAFVAWWVFIWGLTGDPTGWFQGSAQWGHTLGLTAVWSAIMEWSNVRLGDLLFVALVLAGAVLLVRKNLELGAYAVIAILLSIAGAPVESMPRHAMVAFPAFGMIASRLGPKRSLVLALIFAALQANYVVLAFVGPQPFAP
jgi:ketosteroid isomerase-like protein